MPNNRERRQCILDFVARAKHGVASARQIHDMLREAGHPSKVPQISNYVKPLIRSGNLQRIGKDHYCDPASKALAADRYMRHLPYAYHVRGWILLYMLTHRFVHAHEVMAYLARIECSHDRRSVYTAMSKLVKEGYAQRVAQGVFTLTRKTLDLVGLPDVLDDRRVVDCPLGRVILPHVTELFRTLGTTTPKAIHDQLLQRGLPVRRHHTYAAVEKLRASGVIRKLSFGRYACTTAPTPAVHHATAP